MSDISQLKEDISNIRTDIAILIGKIDANHKNLREVVDRSQNLIDKHDKIIYGNGLEGLITSTKRVVDAINSVDKNLDSHVSWDRWIIGLIFIAQSGILLKLFIK